MTPSRSITTPPQASQPAATGMMLPSREQTLAAVNALLPRYEALLAELIRFDSTYGNEGPMQRRVAAEMERLGISVEIVTSRPDGHALNLGGRIIGKDPARHLSLVLNAHADVVPVDAAERWPHEPFGGTIKDRTIYGRGAQDDKAGVTVLLLVVEALGRLGVSLPGDLVVQVVIEEETTGNGTRALLDRGYRGDGVVICDGTWPERLYYAHPGHISFRLRIAGDAMAASNERRAINPVLLGMEMITRLRAAATDRNLDAPAFEGIPAPYFVNVGAFHAGVWCGSVPAEATLDVQMGFPPPATAASMMAEVKAMAAGISERIVVEPWLLTREPFIGDPDAPLIRHLREVVQRHAQGEVQVVPITGYTDMAFFGTPNVTLYGPGGGRNGHGVDEHYMLDHMGGVAANLVTFAVEWCSRPRQA